MKRMKTLLAVAAVLAIGATPAMARDLTAVSFGGAYGAAQKMHMVDPYIEATGNNVLFEDYSGGIAEIKAQVEAGNIQWDVVDIEVIDLERACFRRPAGDHSHRHSAAGRRRHARHRRLLRGSARQ